ncbi:GtrA family protein, partial [Vibrio alfacsensis]
AAKFFMVQFGALMISQGISELFSDLNSYIRVLVVVVILPVVTYLIHKIWTFSDDKNTAAH